MLTIDQGNGAIRIGGAESGGNFHPILTPLDFITPQCTVAFFEIVNLLLLMTAPKIGIGKQLLIVVLFHPLGDDKIFPQTAYVATQVRRIKIVDDGVANARIPKKDFSGSAANTLLLCL